MARWEVFEEWLYDYDMTGKSFAVEDYAADKGIDVSDASEYVQSYLEAQRRQGSTTLYVLARCPGTRTRNARWQVGARTKHARQIGRGLHDDVRAKVIRTFLPDLRRVAQINPRAARASTAMVEAVVDGALRVLEAAVQGLSPDEGTE